MEKFRFCPNDPNNQFAYFKIPSYIEMCRKCEWYYLAADVDALLQAGRGRWRNNSLAQGYGSKLAKTGLSLSR